MHSETQITVRQLRQLVTEAVRGEQPPKELMALVGRMPMNVERRGDVWIATARFSEKKRAEQDGPRLGEGDGNGHKETVGAPRKRLQRLEWADRHRW